MSERGQWQSDFVEYHPGDIVEFDGMLPYNTIFLMVYPLNLCFSQARDTRTSKAIALNPTGRLVRLPPSGRTLAVAVVSNTVSLRSITNNSHIRVHRLLRNGTVLRKVCISLKLRTLISLRNGCQ